MHTFGASILAIMHNACTKAQELNGPMGSLTRRTSTFVSSTFPFIYSMQYQWLAILSFADDHILTLENMLETIFPPSVHLFNGIDKLVYNAECLPRRFDDALNTFPKIVHQLPFLDCVVMHLISWLNFLISTLMHWGSKSMQEKDIMIDTRCNNPTMGLSISVDKANSRKVDDEFPPISISNPLQEKTKVVGKEKSCAEIPKFSQREGKGMIFSEFDLLEDETNMVDNAESPAKSSTSAFSENVISYPTNNSFPCEIKSADMRLETDKIRCSYKAALEKGTKENAETEEDINNANSQYETPRSTVSDEGVEIGKEKELQENIVGFDLDDPILELYDASWHLK